MPGVLIFIGGGSGALLRWLLAAQFTTPWGVVTCNIVGSFFLAALAHPDLGVSPTTRLALGTGLLGGFTTYSTFNLDTLHALQQGHTLTAVLNVAVTLVVALIAGAAGWQVSAWATSGSLSP